MVVIHAQPSTSGTSQKKNRRKLHRKAGEHDAEMQDHSNEAQNLSTTSDLDDEVMIDNENVDLAVDGSAPTFPALSAAAQRSTLKSETRRVPVPPHRMTPLKKDWVTVFGPLTEILGLQVRMNVQRKCVEIRV